MFLKCSLWSHGDFERGWTTQEHGPAEIISAGRLESGRRRSSRCFLMTRKCEYPAVMLTDETNRTFKDPSHHNSYKNSGGFSFLPSRLKDFHVFVWFSCCFSLQHTAVTGHQYPPWSWAADTAGAHSYRLAAVFTDRYRSSHGSHYIYCHSLSFSVWTALQIVFDVTVAEWQNNTMRTCVCLLVINWRCEYKWYPETTFNWTFRSHRRER